MGSDTQVRTSQSNRPTMMIRAIKESNGISINHFIILLISCIGQTSSTRWPFLSSLASIGGDPLVDFWYFDMPASESAIAIACLRDFTRGPCLDPEWRVPILNLWSSCSTPLGPLETGIQTSNKTKSPPSFRKTGSLPLFGDFLSGT